MPTRILDVIVPAEFTNYVVQNTMEASALVQSGVASRNSEIESQLRAGAESFSVPFWNDLSDEEADIVSDDPDVLSVPGKVTSGKQLVRKSFLHKSWSAMNLASELSGDDALSRIQSRAAAYWTRQTQRRLIASLNGMIADNVANDNGDMILDVSGLAAGAAVFDNESVIDAVGTLGDQMGALAGMAVHSDTYKLMLKQDLIEFLPDSAGRPIASYRGMALTVDDLMPIVSGVYTSAFFAPGAVG